jgi:hypothetical protein
LNPDSKWLNPPLFQTISGQSFSIHSLARKGIIWLRDRKPDARYRTPEARRPSQLLAHVRRGIPKRFQRQRPPVAGHLPDRRHSLSLEKRDSLVPLVGAVFALPFVLFSMVGGFFADRYSKRNVAITVKCAELGIMSVASVGLWLDNIPLMLAGIFF